MALSDIILKNGEVILILSSSEQNIVPAGKALNFGLIQRVSQLTNKTTVGQSVWFDIEKAIPFMIISGQIFYKVNEDYITANETIVP